MERNLSRRDFLKLTGVVGAALSLSSCDLLDSLSPKNPDLPTPTYEPIPTITPIPPTPTPDLQILEPPESGGCVLPFENAVVTQRFNQIEYNDGKPVTKNGTILRHLGVDFAPPTGSENDDIPVVSVCDGQLIATATIDRKKGSSLGNVVVIKYLKDGQLYYAVYGHLDKFLTEGHKPGDFIKKGEPIGTLGNSGGWLHKHLHLQIWRELAWNGFVVQENHQNYGFCPEGWSENLINQMLADPFIFLPKGYNGYNFANFITP